MSNKRKKHIGFKQWLNSKGPELRAKIDASGLMSLLLSAYGRGLIEGQKHGFEQVTAKMKKHLDEIKVEQW